jgi:hypothetical protein
MVGFPFCCVVLARDEILFIISTVFRPRERIRPWNQVVCPKRRGRLCDWYEVHPRASTVTLRERPASPGTWLG